MKSSFKLGHIAGIEIGIHYTLIFAIILIAWLLAVGFFPLVTPDQPASTYWILGVLAAIILFVSVLLHELAHSLVARSRGLPVNSITLFIFGGVSNLQQEPESARTEFVMAFVGPLTSLVLGGIFWAIGLGLGANANPFTNFFTSQPEKVSVAAALVSYLASINLILGVFNLIPGFPLDGGRVLRSIIWASTKNLVRSTNIAASIGRYFGWAFIAFGVFQLLGGNFIGGIWIALIGWFLASAADASRREITLREHLSGVKVKEVMDSNPVTAPPGTTVDKVVDEMFLQKGCRAVPIAKDNRLIGIVTIDDVKKLDRSKWSYTPVDSVMAHDPLYTVTPEDDLNKAMNLIAGHDLNQLPVQTPDGQLTGLVCRADILRHVQISQELGVKPGERKP